MAPDNDPDRGRQDVPPDPFIQFTAEQRRRMESEAKQQREVDADLAARLEYIRARVRALLLTPQDGGSGGSGHDGR